MLARFSNGRHLKLHIAAMFLKWMTKVFFSAIFDPMVLNYHKKHILFPISACKMVLQIKKQSKSLKI